MVQTLETLFERELKKLIEARIVEIQQRVAAGSLENFEEYKRQCGQIDGLTAALDLMGIAHTNADQRNR